MKILIVTAYFPPQNVIASLRPYSWAKYWGRLGHEITVCTTLPYGVMSNIDTNLDNVKTIEIPIPFIQKYLVSSYKNSFNVNTGRNLNKLSGKQVVIGYIKSIYRHIFRNTGGVLGLRYPDFRDFWAKKVIKEIKNSFFDMVITTGCPYSVHRVGYFLKRKYPDIFWAVDWRDLWTQNPFFRGLKIFHLHEKTLEKRFHNKCNVITTVSEGLAEDLRKMTSTPVEVIYNGFDSEDYSKLFDFPRKTNSRLTLVYTGSIYRKNQNFFPLLYAIHELQNNGKISPNEMEIVFAGSGCNIQDDINRLGLEKYYTYLGFIPREKSLEIQYNADVVLFGAYQGAKGLLSGKIFEYLSLSKEIWSIGMPEVTDVDKLIEEANAGIWLGTDVEKIKLFILAKISGNETGDEKKKNQDFIASFERKKQAERLLSLYER